MSSSKRASTSTEQAPPAKRTLSSWITASPKPPSPILVSPPFTDRRSTFVAHAAPVSTALGAEQFQKHIRQLRTPDHPREADHEMMGWRTMALKAGRDGLKGDDDWTVRIGGDDDGEKGGSAAIKACIEKEGGVDVCVVVSRWYGGIMLGQDRFRHIRLVTAQALTLLNAALTLPSLITRLEELDSEISIVAPLSSTSPTKPTTDYKGLNTVEKAERLIKAREKRLELLVKMRKHEEEKAHAEEVQTDITEMAELDGRGQKGTADDEAAEAEPAPCRRGFDS